MQHAACSRAMWLAGPDVGMQPSLLAPHQTLLRGGALRTGKGRAAAAAVTTTVAMHAASRVPHLTSTSGVPSAPATCRLALVAGLPEREVGVAALAAAQGAASERRKGGAQVVKGKRISRAQSMPACGRPCGRGRRVPEFAANDSRAQSISMAGNILHVDAGPACCHACNLAVCVLPRV